MNLPNRLINGQSYSYLGSFPRLYADGLLRLLQSKRIPTFMETPFTDSGLTENYLGTYMGDVSLWVPSALLEEVELILQRDHPDASDPTTPQEETGA